MDNDQRTLNIEPMESKEFCNKGGSLSNKKQTHINSWAEVVKVGDRTSPLVVVEEVVQAKLLESAIRRLVS